MRAVPWWIAVYVKAGGGLQDLKDILEVRMVDRFQATDREVAECAVLMPKPGWKLVSLAQEVLSIP